VYLCHIKELFGGVMKVIVKKGNIAEFKSEAVVIPHFEDVRELQGKAKLLDKNGDQTMNNLGHLNG
jgi:hypothetical protein